MAMNDEMRNSDEEMQTDERSRTGKDAQMSGVGGRQENGAPGAGVGRYSDNYHNTGTYLRGVQGGDYRLRELKIIGVPVVWQRVAAEVGFDAFLKVWQVLDVEAEDSTERTRRVRVPAYSKFLKYQRNRFIEAKSSEGYTVQEIKTLVKSVFGEDLSEGHISRLSK